MNIEIDTKNIAKISLSFEDGKLNISCLPKYSRECLVEDLGEPVGETNDHRFEDCLKFFNRVPEHRIYNTLDTSVLANYLESSEGVRKIINVLKKNRHVLKEFN